MAVVIRLQRLGAPKKPFFRVVAVDRRTRRNGRPKEVLGFYQPKAEKVTDKLKVNIDRVNYWLKVGAECSETVQSLLRKIKIAEGSPSVSRANGGKDR